MKAKKSAVLQCGVLLGFAFLATPVVQAQKASLISQPRASAYNRSRELSFQGTIVSLQTQSTSAPFGPHAVVQTSSGTVNIHLGDPRLLQSSGLNLQPGDSVRIVGAPVGAAFYARIVQKGNLTVALRTARGAVLRPSRSSSPAAASNANREPVL